MTLAPEDRDEAVRRLCDRDQGLILEVQSLLASAARIGAFLERPALGKGVEELARESSADESDDLIGTSLGAFRVEKRIASGGMGAVYLGERSDGQFDLKVAIKVVKRGMDSEEILRRFKAERQVLAGLDHPNISRLIDGGLTPDGRPFLVMEHVDGMPIDQYCDHKRMRIAERIELFRQVCDAVHHAHQNLVIHRDIKPSNILVTPLGVPKLLDFGIAKVLTGGSTDQAVTADTDRRLTPEYASPEQVEGQAVTTASDVYSLGVVLYELLTGARPYHFALRTSEEVHRVVCETMPPPPSSAVTVRAARIGTGSGSAPVIATPGTRADSNPPEDVGPRTDIPATRGVSSTRLRGMLRGDLDVIVLHALRKEPHRRYVSVEQFSADLARYLEGMPVQARRDTIAYRASKFVRRHKLGVSLTITALLLLSVSTAVLARVSRQLAEQRDELLASNNSLQQTRRYLTAVLNGGDTANLGPDARLGEVIENAASVLRTSPPEDPLTRAAAEQSLGRAFMSLGMLEQARELLESAAANLASLPSEGEARADVEVALAELLYFEKRFPEAEASFRGMLNQERARLVGAHSESEALLLNNLGACVRLLGRAEEAIQIQREALEARLSVAGEQSLAVAESRNNLGTALFQKGDYAEAITQLKASLQTRLKLLRSDHPLVVRCRYNLGLALLRADEPDPAIEHLTESAELWDRAFGPNHPGVVSANIALAQALRARKRYDDALARLQQAVEWQRRHVPEGSPTRAATEAHVGVTLAEAGRSEEARLILRRVVPILAEAGSGFAAIAQTAGETLATIEKEPVENPDADRPPKESP